MKLLPTNRLTLWLATSFFVLQTCAYSFAGEFVDFEVAQANSHSIVTFPLPETLQSQDHFTLTRKDTGQSIPVQIDRGGPVPLATWIVCEEIPADTARKYRLSAKKTLPTDVPIVAVKDDGKHLQVSLRGQPILAYNHALVESPLADQPYFARSGYIHPLYSPSGQVVTGDFNPDHAHQHGIMFAWRKLIFEGRKFDCWDQKNGLGRVEHVSISAMESGPVFGRFSVELQHVDLTAPKAPKTALLETWNVHIYAVEEFVLFDLESIQRCATKAPVTIEKYHYGGMMFRGPHDWLNKKEGTFLTSEEKTRVNGNHTRPQWVDIAGPLAGQQAGVTIFDHTANFRFPQPVRLHPSMPYFCFSPPVLDAFSIEPGKPYVSKYRYYVHQGKLDSSLAHKLWDSYVSPSRVKTSLEP